MSKTPAAPNAPKHRLKDPLLAALLAFLVPGLGHFYQRRIFKGFLYATCILGTFVWGMRIGHGQVVYFNWQSSENRTYAYLCQFWAGLPAIPALAQAELRSDRMFHPNYVPQAFESPFEGELACDNHTYDGKVSGTIKLEPKSADKPHDWSGKLDGTLTTSGGTVNIAGEVTPGALDVEVAPSGRRRLVGNFDPRGEGGAGPPLRGILKGHIPRPIWNSYAAPLRDMRISELGEEQTDLDRAHFELGSQFELGVVFTMIAGLLNILAIYDALEGPAYEDDEEGTPQPAPPASG